jgi:hypothetical protein
MYKRMERKTLFVFYSLHPESTDWRYTKKFPKGWSWTGSGSTSQLPYTHEEQFNGPKETQSKMRQYLITYFEKLKSQKIIKKYKIRNSYKP